MTAQTHRLRHNAATDLRRDSCIQTARIIPWGEPVEPSPTTARPLARCFRYIPLPAKAYGVFRPSPPALSARPGVAVGEAGFAAVTFGVRP